MRSDGAAGGGWSPYDEDEVAIRARDAMADRLLKDKILTSPLLERAVRMVPRGVFVPPGTPLRTTYDPYQALETTTGRPGEVPALPDVSVQVKMVERSRLRPGGSALQIGSGGYSAALLAEVVGPAGRIVSVDLDDKATQHTAARLQAAGYGDRVTLVCGDAEDVRPEGPFDAVIVTAAVWDIAPAWRRLLAEMGRLVVPLRMNQVTRIVTFRHVGDHLASTAAFDAAFAPMRGADAHEDRQVILRTRYGYSVRLRFDEQQVPDIALLDAVLATDRAERPSGVTAGGGDSFASLALWMACHLPGFCSVHADDSVVLGERWLGWGLVRGDSFAYLATSTLPKARFELVVRGYGPHAEQVTDVIIEQIKGWDRAPRRVRPRFAYWPVGTEPRQLAPGTAVLAKNHGLLTVSWPAVG